MAQLVDFIRQHGDIIYGLMFAYAALHSLIMVLLAGYVAHGGAMDWSTLILVCWTGSFLGDAVRFGIGRRFGTDWLAAVPRLQRGAEKAGRLVDRHYLWLPLIHRYPNGVRSLAGFAFGVSKLPSATFHAINFVSAGVWATALVSAGFLFGHASDQTLSGAASAIGLGALVVFLGLAWALAQKLERSLDRA